MQLKLACADFSFPLLSHDESLALIARLGFTGVDIGVFGGRSHVRPDTVFANIPATARELSDKVHGLGLEFADIFLQAGADFKSLAANHPDASERRQSRDAFRRGLEFAVRCNARHMTTLPGVKWETESPDASVKRCAEELAWRVEQTKNVGVIFSVEPHVGSVVPTPEEAAKLVQLTPGLTLTLDYGHFTYAGYTDAQIEPLIKYASHFHARCACKGRLQAPLKENTIDFARVLQAMNRADYAGYVGVEYVWIDWERCNECDNLSETILLRDLLKGVKL